jgi:hypothetical protein
MSSLRSCSPSIYTDMPVRQGHISGTTLSCPPVNGKPAAPHWRSLSFIGDPRQPDVVEKILRHCGLWKDSLERAPPADCAPGLPCRSALAEAGAEPSPRQLTYDYDFFMQHCA